MGGMAIRGMAKSNNGGQTGGMKLPTA